MSDPRIRTLVHTARKAYRCDGCGLRAIAAGDRYLMHVMFPSHELASGRFRRSPECRDCAVRYGRGHLFTGEEATA